MEDQTMPWEVLSAIVGLSTLETQNSMRLVSKSMKDEVTRNTMKESLLMKDIWWKMRGRKKLYKLREIIYFSKYKNTVKNNIRRERWYDKNGKLHREGNKPADFDVDGFKSAKTEVWTLRFFIHGKRHNVPEPSGVYLNLYKGQLHQMVLVWCYNNIDIASFKMNRHFAPDMENFEIIREDIWKQYFSDWVYSQPFFHYLGYTVPNPSYNITKQLSDPMLEIN